MSFVKTYVVSCWFPTAVCCVVSGPWLQLHGVKPGEKLGILQALEGRLRVVVEQDNQRLLGLPTQVYPP